MRSWAVPVLLACGCNQVWGLDETDTDVDRKSDEDGDGQPNVDDNCPGVINDSQANADRDDAGDACDPHPGLRDRLLDAYYFNLPEKDPSEWTPSAFVFNPGNVYQPIVHKNERMFTQRTRDVKRIAVEAGITLTEFGTFQDNRTGILLDGLVGHQCYVQRVNMLQSRLWVEPAGMNPIGPNLASPLAVGIQFRMVASVDRTTNTVECIIGAAAASAIASNTTAPAPIGLLEVFDSVQFDYVLVWGAD